ncbi:MAG: T9SS type A sorting domain-containing protein, partial [Pseudomonadota bacterium]
LDGPYTEINKDTDKNIKVSIYPNPFTDYINVDSDADAEITILDTQGRTVYTSTPTNTPIYLGDLQSGIYFVNVSDGRSKPSTIKIIKE